MVILGQVMSGHARPAGGVHSLLDLLQVVLLAVVVALLVVVLLLTLKRLPGPAAAAPGIAG